MKKKDIKKLNKDELALLVAIDQMDPIKGYSIMEEKGDVKPINFTPMLDWDYDWGYDWWEDETPYILTKDKTRANRRKATFRKHEQRVKMYTHKGYTINRLPKSDKGKLMEGVGDAPKVIHTDRMYFRGVKKVEKPMTTKEARNLMTQMEWEAEQDRLAEYKEAERQFALDELTSMKDDFKRLSFSEDSLIESMTNLIDTINEAQNQLDMLEPRLNGLMKAKEHLKAEIRKLEEALKQ